MLLFIPSGFTRRRKYRHFKTSYVTVYQMLNALSGAMKEFQNIVCYCLSLTPFFKKCHIKLFQNIVCYCLSYFLKRWIFRLIISKHRMLLFIYHKLMNYFPQHHFKTSYVTVYPDRKSCNSRWSVISKHRMLLFIPLNRSFKYKVSDISKHRMLLFIDTWDVTAKKNILFQNIVCYCLSRKFVHFVSHSVIFQNIVCYCLSPEVPLLIVQK